MDHTLDDTTSGTGTASTSPAEIDRADSTTSTDTTSTERNSTKTNSTKTSSGEAASGESTRQRSTSDTSAGRPGRSRWAALAVLCVGMLMITLDGTVVNVVLPVIQEDLGFTTAGLSGVMNAYLIAFGGLLLLCGRLGDLISRRGVFLAGLAVFTAASVLCGLATSPMQLVAARFVQGVGGAMTSAVILGMIVTMFPEPREQARAIGTYAFVASAGGSVGLVVGGVVTQLAHWQWIFYINLPIGAVTLALAARLLPRDTGAGLGRGTDLWGAALITSGLMVGVYTIVGPAAEHGWLAATTIGLGVLAIGLIAGFLIREATAANPLVPLRIFRSPTVSAANGIQALTVVGLFGMYFLSVLYLQHVLGYDALVTGLACLPITVVTGVVSMRYAERLITRYGALRLLAPGLVLVAAGLGLFARMPLAASYWVDILPALLLLGLGNGICFPAVTSLAMSGVAPKDAGLASGLVNTTTQVGAAVGIAVLATLSTIRTNDLLTQGVAELEALTGGYRLGLLVGAAVVLLAAGVTLVLLRAGRIAGTPQPDGAGETVQTG